MTDQELLRAFDRIRVWQQGGQRAVHKPLLILLALGKLARGEPVMMEFADVDEELKRLLTEFGPSSAPNSRHYPFWHLRTDGLWQLSGPKSILERAPGATPTLSELRQGHVAGGLSPDVVKVLRDKPDLIFLIARRIVEAHFPESLQQDVLDAVGLGAADDVSFDANTATQQRARRDPAFRERVLRAYQYRCCVCAYDLRLGGQLVGLEAAHIKWFQAGGPDVESNGLALCALHHKLFDLGAFMLQVDTYVMVVSQSLVGSGEAAGKMLAYHGAGIVHPQSKSYLPDKAFLSWHHKEVFKVPGRDL